MQTDRPIQHASEDRFDRAPFARRIAEVISRRSDPATLVVGIYGPWGDGKSSTLSLIRESLGDNSPDVVIVNYNPWFFSSSPENLTRSFFLTLGDALEKVSAFSKEKIGKLLKNYGGLVPKLGGLLQAVGNTLSVTDLKHTRIQVEAVLLKHKKPIAVFVDDIDRLDREEIQTLFKLIRLSADFPYVIYILAFDDEIVAAALGEAYETGDKAAGRRFLEKIIQAPLHLPKANGDTLRKMAFEAVDNTLKMNAVELTEQDAHSFGNSFALSLTPLLTTPRQVKLYENALTFSIPLLASEVNAVDLMLLEAIRTFTPRLYLAIRDNSEVFLKGQSEGSKAKKLIDELLLEALKDVELTASESEGLRTWLLEKLFPRISSMGYGSDWDNIWAKARRICSQEYFSRYFSYGVPTGDMPDSLIDKMLIAADSGDQEVIDRHFAYAVKHLAYKTLLRKLRLSEERIPAKSALPFIKSISSTSAFLPREQGMGMDWTVVQAAIFTSNLIQKFPSTAERLDAAKLVFKEAPLFAYLFELLRFTRASEEDGKAHGFFNESDIRSLTTVMTERIEKEANGQPIYRFLGEDARSVLLAWSWYGDRERLRQVIGDSIKMEGADGAEALIEMLTGKGWDMSTGVPHVSDVRRNVYDSIKLMVEPELLLQVLKARYGEKLDDPEFRSDRDTPLGERLALQFSFVHKKSQENDASDAAD